MNLTGIFLAYFYFPFALLGMLVIEGLIIQARLSTMPTATPEEQLRACLINVNDVITKAWTVAYYGTNLAQKAQSQAFVEDVIEKFQQGQKDGLQEALAQSPTPEKGS